MSHRYPLISYQTTTDAGISWSASIARSVGGSIPISGSVAAGTAWGQAAGTDSWHGLLAASIDAALASAGFGAATVTVSYDDGAYAWPRVTLTIAGIANALSWTLTISDATARRSLGYLDTTTSSSGMALSTTCSHMGIWAPMVPWSDIDAQAGYVASQVASPFMPAQATTVTLAARAVRVCQWRRVPARYIVAAYATQATYAGASGNSVLDTYDTLERLVDHASTGALARLYTADATYDTVRLVWDTDVSTTTYAETSTPSGRLYTVTVPCVVAA